MRLLSPRSKTKAKQYILDKAVLAFEVECEQVQIGDVDSEPCVFVDFRTFVGADTDAEFSVIVREQKLFPLFREKECYYICVMKK